MKEKRLTKEEQEAIKYEKFKNKVNRLTEYVHYKRIFSRMEYQKKRREEERKVAAAKKANGNVKNQELKMLSD